MNLLSRTFNDGTVRNQARLQVRFFKNDEDILNSFFIGIENFILEFNQLEN